MVTVTVQGSFRNTDAFLQRMKSRSYLTQLGKYGSAGVAALASATPIESGETAQAWSYEIVNRPGYFAIHWYNSHVENGVPIAAVIQYGHGTRSGGYLQGRDYINPAMRPIFDQIVTDMWQGVTR